VLAPLILTVSAIPHAIPFGKYGSIAQRSVDVGTSIPGALTKTRRSSIWLLPDQPSVQRTERMMRKRKLSPGHQLDDQPPAESLENPQTVQALAETSSETGSTCGIISINSIDSSQLLGFISSSSGNNAASVPTVASVGTSLEACLISSGDDGLFDLKLESSDVSDSDPRWREFLVGVVGGDGPDLGPELTSYAYVLSGDSVPAGSPATSELASESTIWDYDAYAHALTPKWTNEDGSTVTASVVYYNNGYQSYLMLTGDFHSFQSLYGFSVEVALSLVPN